MAITMNTILDSTQTTSMYKKHIKNVNKSREFIDMVIPTFTNTLLEKYPDMVRSYDLDKSELDMTVNGQESVNNVRVLFDNTCKDVLGDNHDELSKYVFSFNTVDESNGAISIIKHK